MMISASVDMVKIKYDDDDESSCGHGKKNKV